VCRAATHPGSDVLLLPLLLLLLFHREGCPTLPPSLTLYSPSGSFSTGSQNPTPPNPSTDPAAAIAAAVAAIEAAAADQQQQLQQQQEVQRQRQQRGRLVVSDSGVRRRVPPSATTAYMTQSVMPQHANTLGITFGGQVRVWLVDKKSQQMHAFQQVLNTFGRCYTLGITFGGQVSSCNKDCKGLLLLRHQHHLQMLQASVYMLHACLWYLTAVN
jgi:hypothetical protein